MRAQRQLADTTLAAHPEHPLIDPEADEVSALILDRHDAQAFGPIAGWSVGGFREWLLSDEADAEAIAALHGR